MARGKAQSAEQQDDTPQGYTAGWYDYYAHEVNLCFWRNGKRAVETIPFRPYFYVPEIAAAELCALSHKEAADLGVAEVEYQRGGKYSKVYLAGSLTKESKEFTISRLQGRGLSPLEADLPPLKRYLVDNPVRFDPEPRVLFFDLETDGSAGWGNIPQHRILSIAWHGNDGRTRSLQAETADDRGEHVLLSQFLDLVVSEHDLLVAWNGKDYDEQVLRERSKYLGLRPDWRQVNFLDLMLLFQKYYQRDPEGTGVRTSFSLNNIAKTVLGKGKIEGVPGHKILEAWKERRSELAKYNERDVDLMVELDGKLGYIQAHAILSHLCGCFLSDWSLMSGYVGDSLILREAGKMGVRFPTKRFSFEGMQQEHEQIEGAFVMDPVVGLYKGVCDLDFAALYPNIVRSFNISPETLVENPEEVPDKSDMCQAGNGSWFWRGVKGVFPTLVETALKGRQEWKDLARRLEDEGKEGTLEHRRAKQRSDAWKVLANSLYGILAAPNLRYYSRDCGEAVTVSGKEIIQMVAAEAGGRGHQVIYIDTDSLFVLSDKEWALAFAKGVEPAIDGYVSKRGGAPGMIRLKLDAEFDRIFFTGKKRYAAKKAGAKPGLWDVRGLELVRSDNCKLTRDTQRDVIRYLLDGEAGDPAGAEEVVERRRKEVLSGKASADDLVVAQSITKNMDDYKTQPVHLRIAKDMKARGLEVYSGMKIPYVVVGREEKVNAKGYKVKGPLKAVHVDDFQPGCYDAAHYWGDKIYPAVERILSAVFPGEVARWKRLGEVEETKRAQADLLSKQKEAQVRGKAEGKPALFLLKDGDESKMSDLRGMMLEWSGEQPVVIVMRILGQTDKRAATQIRIKDDPRLREDAAELLGHDTEVQDGQG